MRRPLTLLATVAILIGLVVAGCGSSSGDESLASSTTAAEAATTTTAVAATTTTVEAANTTSVEATTTTTEAVAGPVTVEIEAFDYGFSGFDTELNAGDILELFNSSESEYHSLIVVRITEESDNSAEYPVKTIEEVIALDPEDIWEGVVVDSFGRVLHAAPGTKAVGRIRLQSSGTYIALDWLPQGADPEALSLLIDPTTGKAASFPFTVPGGPLGYEHGMMVEFEVGDA